MTCVSNLNVLSLRYSGSTVRTVFVYRFGAQHSCLPSKRGSHVSKGLTPGGHCIDRLQHREINGLCIFLLST